MDSRIRRGGFEADRATRIGRSVSSGSSCDTKVPEPILVSK